MSKYIRCGFAKYWTHFRVNSMR